MTRTRSTPSRRARTGVRAAATGLAIAAACALAPPSADASVIANPPPPVVTRACAVAFSCRKTSISIPHAKSDQLELHGTWSTTPPAWATYSLSCSDGTYVSQTITDPYQHVIAALPDARNPAVVTCTASQTIPAGYTTTASFVVVTPPPYDVGYEFVRFASS